MKTYHIKIYEPGATGSFIKTIGEFSFKSFKKQIYSGLGEFSFTIPKKFDDFEEDYVVKHNNRIELWVVDGDSGSIGRKVYEGFISSYQTVLDGEKESVTVTCMGYIEKLNSSLLRSGTNYTLKTDTAAGLTTGDTASACEISDVIRKAIDLYNSEATNPMISYTTGSIEDTGELITYTFETKTFKQVIDLCVEYAPSGWWYYIDEDGVLNFKSKPTEASHAFTIGKDFKSITVSKNMDSVVNNVVFKSTDGSIETLYSDTDSISNYDDRWSLQTDNRVYIQNTADAKGQAVLDEYKSVEIETSMVVVDNNGRQDGYDIESIQPGDTCKIINLNPATSRTFNDNMAIVGITYSPDSVTIELDKLKKNIIGQSIKSNQDKITEEELRGTWSPGDVKLIAYSTPEEGWLLCNGQAVSRTTYAALFAKLGTTWGAGDSSTTFNVPDWRDRVPVGVSGTKALGSTGGAATANLAHTHTGPSHVHTGPNHRHLEVSATDQTSAGSGQFNARDISSTYTGYGGTGNTGSGGTGDTGSGGSSTQAIQNPYAAANWVVKT